MRVMCIGWYDNADQLHLTSKALREYLGWEAKSLALKGTTYLGYAPDWVLGGNVEADEVLDYARDTDFFIFQDLFHILPDLDFRPYLHPGNCCIAATGSNARDRADSLHMSQIREGVNIVTALHDSTISKLVYPAPFDCTVVDTNLIRHLSEGTRRSDVFSVIHAPTNRFVKGSELVRRVMEMFGDDVIYTELSSQSWADCIRAKACHHVTIDQLLIPAYGLNSLESLVLGHRVISNIDPWCYAHIPDLPIRSVYPADEGMEDRLYQEILDAKDLFYAGFLKEQNAEFVEQNFGLWITARRWKHYAEHLKGRLLT